MGDAHNIEQDVIGEINVAKASVAHMVKTLAKCHVQITDSNFTTIADALRCIICNGEHVKFTAIDSEKLNFIFCYFPHSLRTAAHPIVARFVQKLL